MNKRASFFLIFIFLLFVVLIIVLPHLNLGLISGGGITHEEKTDFYNGLKVNLKSAYFGSLTNIQGSAEQRYDFCNSNDGDSSINNEYSIGNEISFISSISSSTRECQGNYFYVTISSVPKNSVVSGSLSLSSSEGKSGTSYAQCNLDEIGGVSLGWKSNKPEPGNSQSGAIPFLSENFNFVKDQSGDIVIKCEEGVGYSGSAKSSFKIKINVPSGLSQYGEIVEASDNIILKIWRSIINFFMRWFS